MQKQESQQNSNLEGFVNLIRSIWLSTSDFPIEDGLAIDRAHEWADILGKDFFSKYKKYIPYLIQRCCQFRQWRGPIHCDEFYRMFCKVCLEKQVYSFREMEWVSETQAMEKILNLRTEFADRYRELEGNQSGQDVILEECRAIIYGWEE